MYPRVDVVVADPKPIEPAARETPADSGAEELAPDHVRKKPQRRARKKT